MFRACVPLVRQSAVGFSFQDRRFVSGSQLLLLRPWAEFRAGGLGCWAAFGA